MGLNGRDSCDMSLLRRGLFMVAMTTSLILIRHYQAIVGSLYHLAGTNMAFSGQSFLVATISVNCSELWFQVLCPSLG